MRLTALRPSLGTLAVLITLATGVALAVDALIGEFDDPWMNVITGVASGLAGWLGVRSSANARATTPS